MSDSVLNRGGGGEGGREKASAEVGGDQAEVVHITRPHEICGEQRKVFSTTFARNIRDHVLF